MKYVDIDVQPDGSLKLDAQGFKGPDCEKVTGEIEKALGGEVSNKTRKPEFFHQQPRQQQQG